MLKKHIFLLSMLNTVNILLNISKLWYVWGFFWLFYKEDFALGLTGRNKSMSHQVCEGLHISEIYW